MGANTTIGLDIGSTSIRAAEAHTAKDGAVTVVAFGERPLPPGAVANGVIEDPGAVTHVVRELRRGVPLRGRSVVLGLTNAQSLVREMSVLNVPRKDMRASLPFQVGDLLPLPAERSVLDFLPLEDAERGANVRGLLIAAPKEPTLAAVSAVEAAGLTVDRVDLTSLALLRALAELDGEVEALVDVGAALTTVIVHVDGAPLIVRTIPRGGDEVTAAVAGRMRVSTEEAEVLKRQASHNQDAGPEVADAVQGALRPLLNEIRNSFAYLNAGGRDADVTRLQLSGGGSLLPSLRWALADQLDVPVQPGDATRRLRPGGLDPAVLGSPVAAVAIGLTLGAA